MRVASIALLLCTSAVASGLQLSDADAEQAPLSHHSSTPVPPFRARLLGLHRNLVSIESITGRENSAASFLVDYLTSRGWEAYLDFVPPMPNTPPRRERFNVVAWRSDGDPSPMLPPKVPPRVLLTSHIDVVPPYIPYGIDAAGKSAGAGVATRGAAHEAGVAGSIGGLLEFDLAGIDANTTIRGRGSVDAKASVAAQIVAAEELLATKEIAESDVMLVYVVGEETTGDGMRHFSAALTRASRDGSNAPALRFDAAIFGEPTQNKLACGHKGHLACAVEAKGMAGHSGYPWLGKSANAVLVEALEKMLKTDLGSDEKWGNTTVNVGTLQGGVAANVIAEEAKALVALRVAIGPERDGGDIVKGRVEALLKEVDAEALSMKCDNGYGVVKCDCDVEGEEPLVLQFQLDQMKV